MQSHVEKEDGLKDDLLKAQEALVEARAKERSVVESVSPTLWLQQEITT